MNDSLCLSVCLGSHGRLVSAVAHGVRRGADAVAVLAARPPAVTHHISAAISIH